jgi:prepilin-type processing-associated H-X9-DG protein
VYNYSGVFPNSNYDSCETDGFNAETCYKNRNASNATRYNSGNYLEQNNIGKSASRWIDAATPFTWFNTILPPNSPTCISNNTDGQPILAPPTSFHSGGCQSGFGDGSVKFISETINWGTPTSLCARSGESPFGVWGAIGSRYGGESVQP